jgi:hypothetical protein
MTDANCRYCSFLGHETPPTVTGTSWEPLTWRCLMDLEIAEGFHHCISYERYAGSDDDLEEALEIAQKASESLSGARSARKRPDVPARYFKGRKKRQGGSE